MTPGAKLAIAMQLYSSGLLCKCYNWQPIDAENSVWAEGATELELLHETNCEGKKAFKEILNFGTETKQ